MADNFSENGIVMMFANKRGESSLIWSVILRVRALLMFVISKIFLGDNEASRFASVRISSNIFSSTVSHLVLYTLAKLSVPRQTFTPAFKNCRNGKQPWRK